MKLLRTGLKRGQFNLLAATRGAQAAMMTLRPGASSESQPHNEHPRSEQWLLVLAGTGEAMVGRRRSALRRVKLRKNSLLLIEKGELHKIENTGKQSLVTFNLYVPPAYDRQGEPKES
jgi:mannose-6-phosphate isomerase-like protein (cupin superfamily)